MAQSKFCRPLVDLDFTCSSTGNLPLISATVFSSFPTCLLQLQDVISGCHIYFLKCVPVCPVKTIVLLMFQVILHQSEIQSLPSLTILVYSQSYLNIVVTRQKNNIGLYDIFSMTGQIDVLDNVLECTAISKLSSSILSIKSLFGTCI